MTSKADIACMGSMRAISMEPALCAFFGVDSKNLTDLEVEVEFLVHNTYIYDFSGADQRLTLTKVNGIEIDYDVNITNQEGLVDLWGNVDSGSTVINIIIGVDQFQIFDIDKA